ncbi:class I SAM-dependent methyltransferase [Leptotrichia sp. oral taxon 847]|uniref:class I SAM-dependent methyltransferase n=1 Tax=Leptotrichia sp. oral taxon 847 TaxID=1785996 RepID=UPI000767FE7C|nr:methyltransferase [Leptotrichia sp. oral taxon 847]AMD95144.1 methyltransferase [Leptotrichia sp. oral taxon 847]
MSHYFSEKQDVKSAKKVINYKIKDEKFEFLTDNGVFSKTKVDFGTDAMLRVFLDENKKLGNIQILDIGCGYGVVSAVLKRFFEKVKILSTDVNERALELTKENIKKNNGKDDFEVRKSFVFENISENFDIILSNPPIRAGKQVIFQIYEESFSHLNKDGKFYCVIQTKHGAKSTQKELHKLFGNCTTLAIESGYRIFKCVNKK